MVSSDSKMHFLIAAYGWYVCLPCVSSREIMTLHWTKNNIANFPWCLKSIICVLLNLTIWDIINNSSEERKEIMIFAKTNEVSTDFYWVFINWRTIRIFSWITSPILENNDYISAIILKERKSFRSVGSN